MADNEKLVFMVTHGPEDPELATIPFVMAVAALASDVEVGDRFPGRTESDWSTRAGPRGSRPPEFPPLSQAD